MMLSRFDRKALKDVEIQEETTITLTTAQGRFRVAEQDDGSLLVTESTHRHLAVLPKTANSAAIHGIEAPDFQPVRPPSADVQMAQDDAAMADMAKQEANRPDAPKVTLEALNALPLGSAATRNQVVYTKGYKGWQMGGSDHVYTAESLLLNGNAAIVFVPHGD